LPGVSRDQVSVAVQGDWLVIRGQRGHVTPPGGSVRYSERRGGAFQRLVPLPARARRDGIQAALSGGVLSVGVPTDGPGGVAQAIEVK
jgi:HSP20 family protein